MQLSLGPPKSSIMKWLYNQHSRNLDPVTHTSKGLVIGRPQPLDSRSIDELEKDGWIGIYDPDQLTVAWNFKIGQNPCLDIPMPNGEPESNLDQRIKETQQAKQKNFRARWNGMKYIYEPIDNCS